MIRYHNVLTTITP